MHLISGILLPIALAFLFQGFFQLYHSKLKVRHSEILFDTLLLFSQLSLILYSGYFNLINLSLFIGIFLLIYFVPKKFPFISVVPLLFFCLIWVCYKYLPAYSHIISLRKFQKILHHFIDPQYIVGTSYLAFKLISFHLDAKNLPSRNAMSFLGWLLFFPSLVSGPIHLYEEWIEQRATFKFSFNAWVTGIRRILFGLFKCFFLAQILSDYSTHTLSAGELLSFSPEQLFLHMVVYTFYLYLNFSGFTDIAIGIALFWGISLPENFDNPYFKRNLQDFWNSWHMSLLEWLKRYLFYPILYTTTKSWLGRIGKNAPVFLAVGVTFTVVGIWHEATINFLLWGILNALALCFLHLLKTGVNWKHPMAKWWKDSKIGFFGSWTITYLFIVFSFVPISLTPKNLALLTRRAAIESGWVKCDTVQEILEKNYKRVKSPHLLCIFGHYKW